MAKIGRPTKYRGDFHPADFLEESRKGSTFAQIAYKWDIDRLTLNKWRARHKEFNSAVKKGRVLAEAWYMNLGRSAMTNSVKINGEKVKVELGWFVWMTKNMFRWSDRTLVKDQPDEPPEDPLADLSDEELDKL